MNLPLPSLSAARCAPAATAPARPVEPAPSGHRPLFDRWFSAWVARSEARWRTVELRQRYY